VADKRANCWGSNWRVVQLWQSLNEEAMAGAKLGIADYQE